MYKSAYVIGYEKRDLIAAKRDFLPFFEQSPFQGVKSPRLPTWSVGSLGLLLHRSNVRLEAWASLLS